MTISKADRPLSPHLQVYKPQITSVLSIFHRMTGVALSLGTLLLVAWLYGAAYDAAFFDIINGLLSHPVGLVALAGWSFAFYYHLANGLRHMLWDTGRGFELKNVTRTGLLVLLFAFGMTGLTWFCILSDKGVL